MSVRTEILNEASTRDNLLRLYTKLETNDIAQKVVDDVAIDVRPPEANEFRDNKLMQVSDGKKVRSFLVGNFDLERFLNGHNQLDGIETHTTSNVQ
jgi:hypothetical protein